MQKITQAMRREHMVNNWLFPKRYHDRISKVLELHVSNLSCVKRLVSCEVPIKLLFYSYFSVIRLFWNKERATGAKRPKQGRPKIPEDNKEIKLSIKSLLIDDMQVVSLESPALLSLTKVLKSTNTFTIIYPKNTG